MIISKIDFWAPVILLFLLLGGCATLPETIEISSSRQQSLISDFKEMILAQQQCPGCIDAEATVAFSSIWQKGTLSGYLQSMSPSSLKFVGINPLGQPLVVFVTNGQSFRYLSVPEAKGYEGVVQGTTYEKYAPEGFLPQHGFYWLIGRLYPGEIAILNVRRDAENAGYWFEISYGNGRRSLVLYDELAKVLLRHIVVNDAGEKILNVMYDEYSSAVCPLPGKVIITSLVHNSTMELRLSGWLADASFSENDFIYTIPPSFERVRVP